MIRMYVSLHSFKKSLTMCLSFLVVFGAFQFSVGSLRAMKEHVAVSTLLSSSTVRVHFIDVGQGESFFIDTLGKDVLIDGGRVVDGPVVLEYLDNLSITCVDLMILTHPHSDRYGGLMTVLNSSISVNQVLYNNESHPPAFLQLAENHNLTVASRGQVFSLAPDVTLTVFNPVQPPQFPPSDFQRHYNNIVVKLQAGNTSFLFTGDANALVEQSMIDAGLDLQSDVLKIGWNGCGESFGDNVTSQGFLEKVSPTYGVVSCDYVGVGLVVPDREVTRRLLVSNITTYTTYQFGTIVASTDGTTITFSDNAHYRYVAELKGHTKTVCSIAWSPDDSLIASGSVDGTVRLWSTASWTIARTIRADAFGVRSVAWSPDGTVLAVGGAEHTVRLWNPQTGEQSAAFNVQSSVLSVSWSSDGGLLAVGLSNGNVQVFDVETGQTAHLLVGHTDVVTSTAWEPGGSRLASGSLDDSICIWDTLNSTLLFTLYANTTVQNDVNGLSWSPDGSTLAAAGQDGNVRLWDPDTGLEMRIVAHHEPGLAGGVSWSPSGFSLVTTGQDYSVHFTRPKTGENAVVLLGHLCPVWSVAWSPSGRLFATGSGPFDPVVAGDTRILVWNTSTIRQESVVVPDDYATIQEAINNASDGDTILVAAGTYYEHVVVNKTVTLIGEDVNTTIIDGSSTGHVVNVISDNVNITGFTVQHSGNVHMPALEAGICLNRTTGCNISGNSVIENGFAGISLLDSPHNLITGNNVSRSGWGGIHLMNSSRNTVSGNTLDSIGLQQNWGGGINGHVTSNYNNIADNVITNCVYGMFYHASAYNSICRNNISAIVSVGIWLQDQVSHNVVAENKLANATVAVWLQGPNTNNTLVANVVTSCNVGFNLTQYSTSNSLLNNTATNCHVGVQLSGSNQNNVSGNHFSENNCSLSLSASYYNRIFDNEIDNNRCGIALQYSSDNRFYHNNIINNTLQVSVLGSGSANIWDNGYPSGGNYWSDYVGSDEDSNWDGIGSTPYIIDPNNKDNYPLTLPFPEKPPFPWDLTGDGYVGIDDILEAATSFGSWPEDPRWNAKADVNNDSYVGIDDIMEIASRFGQSKLLIPEWPGFTLLMSSVVMTLAFLKRDHAGFSMLKQVVAKNSDKSTKE
jgi:parallel beta-helix repeat protein